MPCRFYIVFGIWQIVLSLAFAVRGQAQPPVIPPLAAPAKRLLTPQDSRVWEKLNSPILSADGNWISYSVYREKEGQEEPATLVLQSRDGSRVWKIASDARFVQFSFDSRWACYPISPLPEKDNPALPRRPGMALRNLVTGEERRFDASSADILGHFFIVEGYPATNAPESASVLTMYDLADFSARAVTGVMGWRAAYDFDHILLTRREGSDAVVTLLDTHNWQETLLYKGDMLAGTLRPIDNNTVALFSEQKGSFCLVLSRSVSGKPQVSVLNEQTPGFPAQMHLVPEGSLTFSSDGSMAAFTVRLDAIKPTVKATGGANVEIWRAKEPDTPAQRRRRVQEDHDRTRLCLWNVRENRVLLIDDNSRRDSRILPGFKYVLSHSNVGAAQSGWFLVDTRTGSAAKFANDNLVLLNTGDLVVPNTGDGAVVSQSGRYLAYRVYPDWFVYDTQTGSKRHYAARPNAPYTDKGVIWLDNDAGLVVHDDYDAWLLSPDGSPPLRLTFGREKGAALPLACQV